MTLDEFLTIVLIYMSEHNMLDELIEKYRKDEEKENG